MIRNTLPSISDHIDEVRRSHQYKNSNRVKSLNRQRGQEQVEIRKQKGDNLLKQRRNIFDESPSKQANPGYQPLHIFCLVNGTQQAIDVTLFGMLRETLKYERTAAISSENELVNSDVLSILVQALDTPVDYVQHDVLRCLDKIVISTPEQVRLLFEFRVVDPLLKLSMHRSLKLAKCAITTLSNIAATDADYCDEIILHGGIEEAVTNWIDRIDEFGHELLAWTLSNLADFYDKPGKLPLLFVKGLKMTLQCPDDEVKLYSCLALKSLVRCGEDEKEAVRNSGVLPLLTPILAKKALALHVLQIFVKLSASDLEFLKVEILAELMKFSDSSIKAECLKVVSIIATGSKQVETRIIEAGFIPIVVEILENEEFNCQLEAAKFLYKLSYRGMPDTILAMLPVIPSVCQLLKNNRCPDLLEPLLETLYIVLFTVQNYHVELMGNLLQVVEESGGNCAIDELLLFESKKIVDLSCSINLQFFTDAIPSEANDVVVDDTHHRFWF